MLSIRVLGPLEVFRDQQPVKFSTKKIALLFAYLVSNRDRAHPRESLAGLLWGESPQDRALNSLRNAISSLRKSIESEDESYLIVSSESVRFNDKSDFELDALQLDHALKAALEHEELIKSVADELRNAISSYRGPYLQGFYEDWVLQEQLIYQDQYTKATALLCRHEQQNNRHEQAIEIARDALGHHPEHEQLSAVLIRSLAMTGERQAAIEEYQKHAELLEREYDAEPLPELQLLYEQIKHNQLIETSAVVTNTAAISSPVDVPFIGRERLLNDIISHFKSVRDTGAAQFIFVSGDAGIGKTRLLDEVSRKLDDASGFIFNISCLRASLSPLEPVTSCIARAFAPNDQYISAMPTFLLSEIERLIPAWSDEDETADHPSLPPDQIQTRRFTALSELLRQVSNDRLPCLILDDLQWADESTIQWLEYLINRIHDVPLLCIGTYRADELDVNSSLLDLTASFAGHERVLEQTLPHFDNHESERLLTQMLRPELTEHRDFIEKILSLAHGHPYYLRELAIGLNESGLSDPASLDSYFPKILPDTLQSALDKRIRRLGKTARAILEVGAVLNENWSLPVITAMTNYRQANVVSAILELINANLIAEAESAYRFTHDLIREYLYHKMPGTQRVFLHQSAGEALEQRQVIEKYSPSHLAWHFELAQDHAKALQYWLDSAELSFESYALSDALQQLDRAVAAVEALSLERAESPKKLYEQIARVWMLKAAIYHMRGERERQAEAIAELEQLADTCDDEEMRLCAHLHRANWARMTGRSNEAREAIDKMEALANTTNNELYRDVALRERGMLHEQAGEYELALENLQAIKSKIPSPVAYLMLEDFSEAVHIYMGQFDRALEVNQRRLKELDENEDPWSRMETTSAMGILYEHLGDFERAIECYDREMELAQQVGVLTAQGRSLANRASSLWGAGELEQALNTFTEALKIFEQVGYRRARIIVLVNMGTALVDAGELNEALDCFDEVMADLASEGLQDLELEVLWRKAKALLELGRHQDAYDLSKQAMERVREGANLQSLIRAYYAHSLIARANDLPEESREYLKLAYDELTTQADQIADEHLRRCFLESIRDHVSIRQACESLDETTP